MSKKINEQKSEKMNLSSQSTAIFYNLNHEASELLISNHFKTADYTKRLYITLQNG